MALIHRDVIFNPGNNVSRGIFLYRGYAQGASQEDSNVSHAIFPECAGKERAQLES